MRLIVIKMTITTLATFLSLCAFAKRTTLNLPSLISDNMVVQQNETIAIWGTCKAETKVMVKGSWGKEQEVVSDAKGDWKAMLLTPLAGGPFAMSITTVDTSIIIKNIYAGEVWLASGQSNMEMPLAGWPPKDLIDNSKEEIEKANYPLIRMFTVERAVSDTQLVDVTGSWLVCTPQHAPMFSASAFFFAKELQETLNVPIGIIHSSWGGTPAESWVSQSGLEPIGDFNEYIKKMKLSGEKRKKLMLWMESLPVTNLKGKINETTWSTLSLQDEKAPTLNFDDSKWMKMSLPKQWEGTPVGEFDGVIWFRKEITLSEDEIGIAKLSLGPIDDMDLTYVNGVRVGGYEKDGFWQTDRLYDIPAGTLKKGKNIIAVRVVDNRGGGGIYGKKEQLYVELSKGTKITLAGIWSYLPIAELKNSKLYFFGLENSIYTSRPLSNISITAYSPTALYNAMIAPLVEYKIKGVIWYQGESNVGRGAQYEKLFPALIHDWRKNWNMELPFCFVQIAPYNYGSEQSPALRDAQRLSLSLSKTAMVVTMDIGNNFNIHPSNKSDVGKRLAWSALGVAYAKPIVYSGPLYSSSKTEGEKVIVRFDHVGKGLSVKGDVLTGFEVAGSDGKFYTAKAVIKDNVVEVSSPKVKKPVTVRYAWKDKVESPSLFNADGLPASSFQSKR